MKTYMPSEIWDACALALAEKQGKPLAVEVVASATGLSEEDVISTLIHEATDGRVVTFVFPPLPRPAIKAMTPRKPKP